MNVKTYATLMLALVTATACGDKKNVDDAVPAEQEQQAASQVKTPYATPALTRSDTLTLGGRTLYVRVSRAADRSLSVVTDELGSQFYDNTVAVIVQQASGEMFFTKNFTKADFAEFLSEGEAKVNVLLGMALNREATDGVALRFGAQVGQPGIEEGPAFVVEVPLNGSKCRIVRDNRQDTTGEDAVTEQD